MLTNRIPRSEYENRWYRVQALAKQNDVDALIVWGKGGGTVDMASDLIYLANYCPVFPYVPDVPGHFSGLGHAAVIIPVNGEPVLVTDNPGVRRDVVPVEDIRAAHGFVPDTVIETLQDMGLGNSRLGQVAGPWTASSVLRRFTELATGIKLVDMDLAVESLKIHKTELEFELLREAADVGSAAMEALMKTASVTGNTEADAVAAAYEVAVRRGALIMDVPSTSGPFTGLYSYGMAPNWTTRKLQPGDIFHADMSGAAAEGYAWDISRTVPAGGKWKAEHAEIYDGAIAAVETGIAACRPGIVAGDLYDVVANALKARDIFLGFPVHGHSFGIGWEAPWVVPGGEAVIEAGMAMAIEVIAGHENGTQVRFEQNILVHHDRNELISLCPPRL